MFSGKLPPTPTDHNIGKNTNGSRQGKETTRKAARDADRYDGMFFSLSFLFFFNCTNMYMYIDSVYYTYTHISTATTVAPDDD